MTDKKWTLEQEIQQGEEALANKPKWDFSTDGGMRLLDKLLEGKTLQLPALPASGVGDMSQEQGAKGEEQEGSSQAVSSGQGLVSRCIRIDGGGCPGCVLYKECRI